MAREVRTTMRYGRSMIDPRLCILLAVAALSACDSSESATGSGGATNGSGAGGPGVGGAGAGGDGAASGTGGDGSGAAGGDAPIAVPPPNAQLDYQLGGAYPPPAGVAVVSRNRAAAPAPGLYNICYVNGFQAQAEEAEWWLTEHPDLVLRDQNGDPIIDVDWDEMLLDISTAEKRDALAAIVGSWIEQCDADGFDAAEIDNLDSYARSEGLLTQDHAVAFMQLLSTRAHEHGLAIAQKNSTEILARRAEMGTDFAIAEECNRYSECSDYTDVYGDLVFVIEYRQEDFDAGCTDHPNLSIVLRDLNLVEPSSGDYVYEAC
jgi:hypothetical protein